MSVFASINERLDVPKLRVTRYPHEDEYEDNNKTLLGKDSVLEDVQDPRYESDEYALAYPPNPKFITSYKYYLEHVACTWTVNENDPAVDYDKFSTAPVAFQRVILRTAACIMIGDSVVLDKLRIHVTPINVKMMFVNQEDRENTHQITYSRWCDVSSDGDYYRSMEFRKKYMSRFDLLAQKYKDADIGVTLFFIMLCENVMFAPMFQILCYLATTGYAPHISNANRLVMRDECIHYRHARELLSSFRHKPSFEFARTILDEFCELTLSLARDILEDYDDETLNYRNVEAHFRHVVYGFMSENSLFRDETEESMYESLYGETPASSYMSLPETEIKINLMETMSTVYRLPGIQKPVDMNF